MKAIRQVLYTVVAAILFTSVAVGQDYDTVKQAITNITAPALTALDQYKANVDAQIAPLQQQINDLQSQVSSLQSQLATAQQQVQADQTQIASLTSQLATAQTNLAATQAQLAALQSTQSPAGMADMQMHGDWAVHVADPSIGPWATGSTYGFAQFQKQGDAQYAMKLSVQGVLGSYSDVLWSITRKPLPPAGTITYTGRLWVESNTATGAQAIEIDTIVSKASLRYNFSSQINVAKGWMLQISGDSSWKDTGCVVGPLSPGLWHNFRWTYTWSDTTHQYSFISFILDTTVCVIPSTMQNMTASATNWTDSIHPQLQIDTNSKGVGYSVWYDNLDYHSSKQ